MSRTLLNRLSAAALLASAGLALASCQHATTEADAGRALAHGGRPNILLIVGDDLGYMDLGVYGSEIRTPNIDALAAAGVVLTNYYVSVSCQPTRSMLLSGTDNHLAGVGSQGRVVEGDPGYQARLNDRVASIADRMRALDYHTYMVGKWHLGEEPGQTPADRGFERSYVLLQGGASHFEDKLGYSATVNADYQDDGVDVPALPAGFYSTVNYTDEMIERIDAGKDDGKPFFAFVSYTAPHWPIHALDEDMARTRGRYDEGYDVIRERRYARWKELGFAPPDASPPRLPAGLEPWDSLSPERQALEARTMEAYAAMVERLDREVGRLLDHLREEGQLENTLIFFMADNGAEATSNESGFFADYRNSFDNSLDNIGRPGSYRFIGAGWGEAGAASYFLSKGSTADGGTHVPGIVSAPALGLAPGRSDALVSVIDLGPTFVDLAGGVPGPITVGGTERLPMSGRSFAALLRGEVRATRGAEDAVAWEAGGQRALRQGDWKILMIRTPNGTGTWQLFNLADDPSETTDVAAAHPEILAELAAKWDQYAEEDGVIVNAPDLTAPPPGAGSAL